MKTYNQLKEELIVEQGRATINKVGSQYHGQSGQIVAHHIDGSVDVKIVNNGQPTVVRVYRKHLTQVRESVEETELNEADTYGWRTNKTPEGHKWNVYSVTHGESDKVLHSGIEDTRAKAVARAKKHVMPYRRGVKEELELDEVLDAHKGIQSYIKKSAEKRADLVKNDSITKPDHAEVRRKLEKSNKGFDKAIDKQYKLNKEEIELDEKLDPSMGAGEYVKDFKKSDAPQFKGKSSEKRRNMGVAAFLAATQEKNK